jgi:hypothetical protein
MMNRVLRGPAMAVLVAVLVAACDGSAPTPGAERDAAGAATDSAAFVAQADAAAQELMRSLGGRLTAALAEGGAAHAIEFCSTVAMPLTDSVAAAHGVEMQRVTTRTRNPVNTPDAVDRMAISHFELTVREGGMPTGHVERGPDGRLRYYRPLLVNAMCVQCHGPADGLAPEVVRALQSRYPDDQATGYAENDVRGVIRVVQPASGN